MIKVHLLGPLAEIHRGPIQIMASTAWEAVEAISRQLPGFRDGPPKVVQVLGCETVDDLKRHVEPGTDIFLAPVIAFGKSDGLTQIIIGTVLVAAAFLSGGTTLPLIFGSAALSFFIGGAMALITPQPTLGGKGEEEIRSRYLPGIQNTTEVGTPAGILYGCRRIGGHILSLNIDAKATSR